MLYLIPNGLIAEVEENTTNPMYQSIYPSWARLLLDAEARWLKEASNEDEIREGEMPYHLRKILDECIRRDETIRLFHMEGIYECGLRFECRHPKTHPGTETHVIIERGPRQENTDVYVWETPRWEGDFHYKPH